MTSHGQPAALWLSLPARRVPLLLLCLSSSVSHSLAVDIFNTYKQEGPVGENLPDFSKAGYYMGISPPPDEIVTDCPSPMENFDVSQYSAIPDDGLDDSTAIQQAIDAASAKGGGVVMLPSGRFHIRGGDREHTIRISSNCIVLRGSSGYHQINEEEGAPTILFLENPSGTVNDGLGLMGQRDDDPRSLAAVSIEAPTDRIPITYFQQEHDLLRGETLIPVLTSSGLRAGQIIRIQLTDPLVDTDSPGPDKIDLIRNLTKPFQFSGEESDTFGRYGKTVEYITRIESVIDEFHIRLLQPLRFDHLARYRPVIVAFNGLTNVGIENLAFECAWPGGYVHHKPFPYNATSDKIERSAREQDYGWVGIWSNWQADGFIRNVTLTNYTKPIVVVNSAFMDLEDIDFHGHAAHAGITFSSAYSNLVRSIHLFGRFVHPLSVRAWSSGNVFTEVKIHYEDFNPMDRTGPFLDFHGLFPYENLFENIDGAYVYSGGDPTVLPHAGVRNCFWNIRTPPEILRFDYSRNEFLETAATSGNRMYQHYPGSFIVGVHSPDGLLEVTVARSAKDRATDELYVEALNNHAAMLIVPSLYQAQVAYHKATPLSSGAPDPAPSSAATPDSAPSSGTPDPAPSSSAIPDSAPSSDSVPATATSGAGDNIRSLPDSIFVLLYGSVSILLVGLRAY